MRKVEELSKNISKDNLSKIKIKFNEYAIEKYGCSELDLKMFHKDYDNAVIHYKKKNDMKIVAGTLLTILGIGGAIAGLGGVLYTTIFATNVLASQISLLTTGAALSLSTGGLSLRLYGNISNDMEYDLKRRNPYILKGTIFQTMAEDYSKLRTLIKKKS